MSSAPSKESVKHLSMDWTGFGFVALSLGCLQVVLDRGQEDDWFSSAFIIALLLVSAIAFVLLIWRELNARDPLVDIRLMLNRNFAVPFVLMLMLGFMLLGSTYPDPGLHSEPHGVPGDGCGNGPDSRRYRHDRAAAAGRARDEQGGPARAGRDRPHR